MRGPPPWWDWPLRLTPHLEERMIDRGFSEVEVRSMMKRAEAVRPEREPGRFVVEAQHLGGRWRLIVEPDPDREQIVVITGWRIS